MNLHDFLRIYEDKATSNANDMFKRRLLIHTVMFRAKWASWNIHIGYLIIKHIIDNTTSAHMNFLELNRCYEAKIT